MFKIDSITYRRLVGIVGLTLLLASTYMVGWNLEPLDYAVFVAMAIATSMARIPMPQGSLTFGFAIVLPMFILFGPVMAAWVYCVGHLVGNGLVRRRHYEIALFNFSQFALAILGAGWVARLVGGPSVPFPSLSALPALLIFIVLYLAINNVVVFHYFILAGTRVGWRDYLESHFRWSALLHLGSSALGALLALAFIETGIAGSVLVFIPMLIVAYLFGLHLRLQMATREMLVLYEFSRDLTGALNLERVFSLASQAAAQLIDHDNLILFLYDERNGELSPITAEGLDLGKVEGWSMAIGDGIVGSVAQSLQHELIDDVRKDSRASPHPSTNVRCLMAIPLVVEGKLIGVLAAGKESPGAFRRDHLRPMSILSSQMAVAIQNAILYERTERMAITDPVTDLYNYRYFYLKLGQVIRHSRRLGQPSSLVYIDIDKFKHYNDVHGHIAGDRVLKDLARIISEQIRSTDVAARYAGDEFAILLPDTGAEEANMVAERLVERVESHRFRDHKDRRRIEVPISVGVATFPDDAETETELIHAADQNMFRQKEAKRQWTGTADQL